MLMYQDDVTEDDGKDFVKERVVPFKHLEGGVSDFY